VKWHDEKFYETRARRTDKEQTKERTHKSVIAASKLVVVFDAS
jgi:hypothetical protein